MSKLNLTQRGLYFVTLNDGREFNAWYNPSRCVWFIGATEVGAHDTIYGKLIKSAEFLEDPFLIYA